MIKTCKICGKKFKTKYNNQTLCSRECQQRYMRSTTTRAPQPNRSVTADTYLLVELYWKKDGYNARRIAEELHRDVAVIEEILDNIKRGIYPKPPDPPSKGA